jgi:hypothetical protein
MHPACTLVPVIFFAGLFPTPLPTIVPRAAPLRPHPRFPVAATERPSTYRPLLVAFTAQRPEGASPKSGEASAPRITRRVEQPLTKLEPVEGGRVVETDVTIRGRVFANALTMDTEPHGGEKVGRSRVVFANKDGNDVFETWIGFRGGYGDGVDTFTILGDGEEIYRSPKLRQNDPPLHVSVSITGCSGISLVVEGEGSTYSNNAVWAEPVLVKLPPMVPVPVSPGLNERITQDTPLVWKAVEGASGYFLELQCERLANLKEAAGKTRFLAVTLPATTTVYTFPAGELPKGRWRWRVHSLSPSGFLGEAQQWRPFASL